MITTPIVGAHFRPPAKLILQFAPMNWRLRLEREPYNQYDSHAIAVFGTVESKESLAELYDIWPEAAINALSEVSPEAGFSIDEILGTEFQLGYLPGTQQKKWPQAVPLVGTLAPRWDAMGLEFLHAKLGFMPWGDPAASFEMPSDPSIQDFGDSSQ